MGKTDIHSLTPGQLAGLLSIGIEADPSESGELISDEQIRDAFASLMQRQVPCDATIIDSILIFLGENDRYGKHLSGHSLCDILIDPATELDLLKTIKDYSKKIYQTTVSRGENSMAAAIYYAAIAAGLVHYDMKISGHSWQTLKTAFYDLVGKSWMLPQLATLLEQAYKRCEMELADQ